MACGHCRLKIESELRSAGFKYIDFDMLHDIVALKEEEGSFSAAERAITSAGYLVDLDFKEQDTLIKFSVSCTKEELLTAISTINAELITFTEQSCEVQYADDPSEIYEVLDAFGIEYDS